MCSTLVTAASQDQDGYTLTGKTGIKKHKKMLKKLSIYRGFVLAAVLAVFSATAEAQQDPQYTQYMYNTMSVNPAYAGQRETLSVTGLYRTQWVGLDGAPDTQTFGIHAPLSNERIGLGLSVVNDALGPADETYVDANFAYTVPLDRLYTKMTFGLKAGLHALRVDWSEGRFRDPDVVFNEAGDKMFVMYDRSRAKTPEIVITTVSEAAIVAGQPGAFSSRTVNQQP